MNRQIIMKKNLSDLNLQLHKLAHVQPPEKGENMHQNVQSTKYMCEDLNQAVEEIGDALFDVETAIVYDKDANLAAQCLVKSLLAAQKLDGLVKELKGYLGCAVEDFINTTPVSTFTPVMSDEEMRIIIDEGFDQYPVMTLAYRNGEYAIAFGESEEDEVVVPIVIGRGKEEDVEEARAYLETFMDMETNEV